MADLFSPYFAKAGSHSCHFCHPYLPPQMLKTFSIFQTSACILHSLLDKNSATKNSDISQILEYIQSVFLGVENYLFRNLQIFLLLLTQFPLNDQSQEACSNLLLLNQHSLRGLLFKLPRISESNHGFILCWLL